MRDFSTTFSLVTPVASASLPRYSDTRLSSDLNCQFMGVVVSESISHSNSMLGWLLDNFS